MTQALLESRWGETKEALLEGLQGSRRTTMGVILENTRKMLAESRVEVTGDKSAKVNVESVDNNVVELKRLAGLN